VNSSNLTLSPQEDSPFSIGAVTQITGITETTLRVWERRYHFPHTSRTSGGRRQYSQQAVLQLQWVKMHMDEGVRAGRAIRARSLTDRETAVATTLHELLLPLRTPDPTLVTLPPVLLDALLAFDSAKAAMILNEAITKHPLENIVLDVIGPALSAIGEFWSNGEVEVATEHFATNFLRHQLLVWMRTSPPPYRVNPIILACAPEELHEGSLLMLGVLLRQLRWPVLYLGQSLPLLDLSALVDRVMPSLIVFVAMSEIAALALADWPLWLIQQTEMPLPIIGYGGRAFVENTALADLVPGVLLGTTIYEGYQRIHRVMLNLAVLQP